MRAFSDLLTTVIVFHLIIDPNMNAGVNVDLLDTLPYDIANMDSLLAEDPI